MSPGSFLSATDQSVLSGKLAIVLRGYRAFHTTSLDGWKRLFDLLRAFSHDDISYNPHPASLRSLTLVFGPVATRVGLDISVGPTPDFQK